MHEYPITQQIIRTAEEKALENNCKAVTEIHLVIGEYSGYMGESIELYFDLLSEGTLCQKARLKIEKVPAMVKCNKCGAIFKRLPLSFSCINSACEGEATLTDIGKEFYIKSVLCL